MEIKRTAITIRELTEGYVNETETDIEQGVYAYNGKLCVEVFSLFFCDCILPLKQKNVKSFFQIHFPLRRITKTNAPRG